MELSNILTGAQQRIVKKNKVYTVKVTESKNGYCFPAMYVLMTTQHALTHVCVNLLLDPIGRMYGHKLNYGRKVIIFGERSIPVRLHCKVHF